jgi:hypothetical protein
MASDTQGDRNAKEKCELGHSKSSSHQVGKVYIRARASQLPVPKFLVNPLAETQDVFVRQFAKDRNCDASRIIEVKKPDFERVIYIGFDPR